MQDHKDGAVYKQNGWHPSWRCHVQNYAPIAASATDLTQQLTFQNNLHGTKLRIRLSNQYGQEPLPVKKIQVQVFHKCSKSSSKESAEKYCALLMDGKEKKILQPGEECMTDPLSISLKPGDFITVRITFPGKCHISGCCGFHSSDIGKVDFESSGKRIDADKISLAVAKNFSTHVVFGIRSIEVCTIGKPVVLAAFGDSIVQQGYWTGSIQKKFADFMPDWIVYNEGISGNRVLYDNHSISDLNPIFGRAGIHRFEKDVFSHSSPDIVMIAEGINELVHPGNGCPISETVTAKELIEGFKVLCTLTEQRGSIPLLATLSPFLGYDGIWDRKREDVRLEVNEWIRGRPYVLDVDACVRSTRNASYLDRQFDSGDHLHLNACAGEVISDEAIPILKAIMEKETAV